jgi:hypothetical protein
MASYPPAAGGSDQREWRVATRFLTIGMVLAALLAGLWWINRLADRMDAQRNLLLQIQRDVLVNQAQVGAVLAVSAENGRRLGTVEDRVANAADDRRQMRETDSKLLEAIVRLRAALEVKPHLDAHDRVP